MKHVTKLQRENSISNRHLVVTATAAAIKEFVAGIFVLTTPLVKVVVVVVVVVVKCIYVEALLVLDEDFF